MAAQKHDKAVGVMSTVKHLLRTQLHASDQSFNQPQVTISHQFINQPSSEQTLMHLVLSGFYGKNVLMKGFIFALL